MLKKRAKRKFMSLPVMKQLLALKSPLHSRYINTLSCCASINTNDGKIQSRYCKRMWCGVCQPIKTAVRMNGYKDILNDLGDLQLTTLTIQNCSHEQITSSIKHFRSVFRQYRNTLKKRGHTFRGVYNFEVTYNRSTGLYHPHIHIIHECIPMYEKSDSEHSGKYAFDEFGEQISEYKNGLIDYWIRRTPKANYRGQDTRICYDLIEGFKYASKSIFKLKVDGKFQPYIPVVELDKIYQALQGVRCFQSFGLKKIQIDEDKEFDELAAYNTDKPDGSYRWFRNDWHLLHDNNIKLSGYVPSNREKQYNEKLNSNAYYKPPS